VGWQNINITNNEAGQPHAELSDMAQTVMANLGASCLSVSLSDEQEYVLAFAVLS
jgi:phosphopantetheinyl transferase (holo-ACP synthase)